MAGHAQKRLVITFELNSEATARCNTARSEHARRLRYMELNVIIIMRTFLAPRLIELL